MHLTLKKEATRPPGLNSLQQQAKFDAFVQEFNADRPQALAMRCPAELYIPSSRPYDGLPELEYLADVAGLVRAARLGRLFAIDRDKWTRSPECAVAFDLLMAEGPSTAVGSIWRNPNSASFPPNASIAGFPTKERSSTRSPPGNTTATSFPPSRQSCKGAYFGPVVDARAWPA